MSERGMNSRDYEREGCEKVEIMNERGMKK